jgi:hypothetical protein
MHTHQLNPPPSETPDRADLGQAFRVQAHAVAVPPLGVHHHRPSHSSAALQCSQPHSADQKRREQGPQKFEDVQHATWLTVRAMGGSLLSARTATTANERQEQPAEGLRMYL